MITTAYETDFAAVPANLRQLERMIAPCRLCPRACGVDRTAGQTGACGSGPLPVVASYCPHFGEECVLVGEGGSGTIFFSGCSLACVFCQNSDISQRLCGQETEPRALAGLMLQLQQQGCRNINLVSPTHVAHAIARAIALARRVGRDHFSGTVEFRVESVFWPLTGLLNVQPKGVGHGRREEHGASVAGVVRGSDEAGDRADVAAGDAGREPGS